MLRLTDVVKNLLVLNVIVFLASFVINLDALALRYPGAPGFGPWQLVTYAFMHSKVFFGHILFNMLGLVIFGSALETLWGAKKFLFYYFACALGAAGLHLLLIYFEVSQLQAAMEAFQQAPSYDAYWNFFKEINIDRYDPQIKDWIINTGTEIQRDQMEVVPTALSQMQGMVDRKMGGQMLGASGAIFGLLLAFGIKFPDAEMIIFPIPIPIKAKFYIPILMVLEFYLGINNAAGDNVAHFAHLGGAVMGLILILFGRYFKNSY